MISARVTYGMTAGTFSDRFASHRAKKDSSNEHNRKLIMWLLSAGASRSRCTSYLGDFYL